MEPAADFHKQPWAIVVWRRQVATDAVPKSWLIGPGAGPSTRGKKTSVFMLSYGIKEGDTKKSDLSMLESVVKLTTYRVRGGGLEPVKRAETSRVFTGREALNGRGRPRIVPGSNNSMATAAHALNDLPASAV